MPATRTVADIDADLTAYATRRRHMLDQLITDMLMLNAIDRRVEALLDQRHAAAPAIA